MYTFSFFCSANPSWGRAGGGQALPLASLAPASQRHKCLRNSCFQQGAEGQHMSFRAKIGEKFAKHWIFRDVLKHRFDTERKKTSKAR